MAFAPHAGWILWHGLASDDDWAGVWCIVSRDVIQVFEAEESDMPLAEYDITNTSRILVRGDSGVPASVGSHLAQRAFAFMFTPTDSDENIACFDAEDEDAFDTWTRILRLAILAPRELEAYIDDFSDVEDDAHARRCSLEALDDADWAKVRSARSRGSAVSEGKHSKSISVRSARLDDGEAGEAARRFSLESTLDMDWTTLGRSRVPTETTEATGAQMSSKMLSASDEEEEVPNGALAARCDEGALAARKDGFVKTKDFEEHFGECW
mmetsp:Transcript_71071/g.199361  ORF Transcript_71071/g.199361 Transcript_71071/m.199361 type:complete len:268 (-) Transcript_71071:104-907(-)